MNKINSSKIDSLSSTEKKYFKIMLAKYGVLYITSKPGVAKSAIGRSIAEKMGYKYLDIRLSINDETDFKFPFLEKKKHEGAEVTVSGYAVPNWAYEANNQPTIIHFDELNRASLFVRNAALQIMLEREIGNFKFNDNVLMMASGNLGEEDGTDVEEFDTALNNRLIHIDHKLTVDEWIHNFAKDNCHPLITSFIESNPDYFYKSPKDNSPAYPTPRTWTMLSEYIITNFGIESKPNDFLDDVRDIGYGYVGNSVIKFIKYCEESNSINIYDVLNNFSKIKDSLDKYNRSKKSELLRTLRSVDFNSFKKPQIKNLTLFVDTIDDDEKLSYLLYLIDNNDILSNDNLKEFLLNFREILNKVKHFNNQKTEVL